MKKIKIQLGCTAGYPIAWAIKLKLKSDFMQRRKMFDDDC